MPTPALLSSPSPARFSLNIIDVARPCEADWDAMRGNDHVRFCGHCSLHVYNLSEMPQREAERLVLETQGRLCVRFYRRADGTVTTRDCGIKAAAKWLGRWTAAATAVVLSAALAPLGLTRWSSASPTEKCDPRVTLPAAQPNVIKGEMAPLMGKMRAPAPPPTVTMGTPAPILIEPQAAPPATQPVAPATQPAPPAAPTS